MESETLADLSPAMATPVPGGGKRRVAGSTISGQTEEESQFLSTLTQQIEDLNKEISTEEESQFVSTLTQQIEELNKEISCFKSRKLVVEKMISEKRAARASTKIAPLEITKQLLDAFADKLENGFQYFDFKEYAVANKLLDPLPMSDPYPDFDKFIKDVASRSEIRQKFPKLETVDLVNALRACLDGWKIDKAYHFLYLRLQALRGRPVLESDPEPSVEELEKFIEVYPSLKSMTPQEMEKRRVDLYVAANPILQLVNKVRSGHYHMDQDLEVELRKLMMTRTLGKTFDGFNKAVSTPMEESHTKEMYDLLSQDDELQCEICRLQMEVKDNQIKIDKIYRMRQLKLDAIKDLEALEADEMDLEALEADEMVIEAFNKYKELTNARGATGEIAVRR